MDGFPIAVALSPNEWPEICRDPRPGDLRLFIPQGFGLGAPLLVTPYSGVAQGAYYAFDEPQAHPVFNAPLTEPSGGSLYFDEGASIDSLDAALRLIGVYQTLDYCAFGMSSAEPLNDHYLDQMRFVSRMALTSVFGATVSEPVPKQSLNILQAAASFTVAQRKKWKDRSRLAGMAGGDGDWAKESWGFGFHVLNTYLGIYRIWSRAWLVTK